MVVQSVAGRVGILVFTLALGERGLKNGSKRNLNDDSIAQSDGATHWILRSRIAAPRPSRAVAGERATRRFTLWCPDCSWTTHLRTRHPQPCHLFRDGRARAACPDPRFARPNRKDLHVPVSEHLADHGLAFAEHLGAGASCSGHSELGITAPVRCPHSAATAARRLRCREPICPV